MKKLNITWEGVNDTTGYLFSFAKALAVTVKNSPYSELYEDIVATSGFAFRMWVAPDLCPSATSIWEFRRQKPWVESGGLICGYVERLWEQDELEEERRQNALSMIRESINHNIAAIAWDIGIPEWGLIIGYDDQTQRLAALSATGAELEMEYASLGKGEIPILNVLAITGRGDKRQEDIISDTLKLARAHLMGEEWCENAKGLAAYGALIQHFEDAFQPEGLWNLEYYLGTYGALKWYAWRFFEKYALTELGSLYRKVFEAWQRAFELIKTSDLLLEENRKSIADLLKTAEEWEKQAVMLMK